MHGHEAWLNGPSPSKRKSASGDRRWLAGAARQDHRLIRSIGQAHLSISREHHHETYLNVASITFIHGMIEIFGFLFLIVSIFCGVFEP